jgi:hypothetical protein
MLHARRLSPFVAALAALLLAVSPVAAASPFTPATGHWASVDGAVPGGLSGASSWIWDTRMGPDGKLYAMGNFANASGNATADMLAYYDTTSKTWKGLGTNGAGDGALNDAVYAVAWIGTKLYAAGRFTNAGGVAGADHVAVWNGSSWGRVGPASAFTGDVSGLAYSGGLLYAWGAFTDAASDPTADYIAAWDGTTWFGLNSAGALDGAINGWVWSASILPDGEVYVAGNFGNVGPDGKCDSVCWWDPGSESWNPVGGSAAPDNAFNFGAYAVMVSGSKVYVGGRFTNVAGNSKADYIAVWNGTAWTNLGSIGTDGALNGWVYGIRAYGSNLIVTGGFTSAAGMSDANNVVAWNGSKWLQLGTPAATGEALKSMISGRTLYVGGEGTSIIDVGHTNNIAAYGLPAAPSAPRSLAGLSGSHKVTLSWALPSTYNGGGSPIDYVVQYRKYGTTTWKTFADGVHTTRSAAVTGLSSGGKYQFRVAAKNAWGVGTYSATITRTAK